MFFYKRLKEAKTKDEAPETVWDFFNPRNVVRGVWMEDYLVILLNDGHEISKTIVPARYNKDGKLIAEAKKVREHVVSEIYLDKEDAGRYKVLYEDKSFEDYPSPSFLEETAEIESINQ